MGVWEISAFQLIKSGGPVMYPIMLCSIFAVGVFIEKMILFWNIKADPYELKQKVFDYIKNNKLKEAIQYCDTQKSPIAEIFKSGISKFGSSREEIKEAMEDVSLFEVPQLERRINTLATIANITPLLGLLGTVMGLTDSFHSIQMKATSLNPVTPGDLAGGIWSALLTTVAGLVVAIPTFVAYNYCVSRANHIILDMERGATELVNFISHLTESSANQ